MAGSGSGSGSGKCLCNSNIDEKMMKNWGIRVLCLRMTTMILMMMMMMIAVGSCDNVPTPRAWPEQFHSVLVSNNTKTMKQQVIDLWYDWPNGRNLNLIQNQLGKLLHDVEWNNGTSFYYSNNGEEGECRTIHFEVGILRPNWLEGAIYLGQRHVDGFLCNVWYKADFIWYYEDVISKRPVHWLFYTGMAVHVITFEVGAVLEDSQWQAPPYCFHNNNNNKKSSVIDDYVHHHTHFGIRLPFLTRTSFSS